jgi:hypothetical protein
MHAMTLARYRIGEKMSSPFPPARQREWMSLQNWQSEFLSIFAVVVFSIFLREQDSPQSKPVDAANSETGD